jgi:hypothetical protein
MRRHMLRTSLIQRMHEGSIPMNVHAGPSLHAVRHVAAKRA